MQYWEIETENFSLEDGGETGRLRMYDTKENISVISKMLSKVRIVRYRQVEETF